MYCIKCGQELEGRPKFCPYCGQQLTQVRRPEARRKAMSPPRWLVTSGLSLLALILGGIVAAGGAYFWLGMHRQNRAATILPEDTEALVCISPTLLQLPQLRNLDNALGSGALVAALPGVTDATSALQQNLPSDFDIDFNRDVRPWIGREVSLAVVPADAGPSLVLTAVTRNRDLSDAFLDRLRAAMEQQDFTFEENTYRSTEIIEIRTYGSPSFAYGTVNSMVVVASDVETLEASIDAAEQGRSSTLHGRKSFKDALRGLPANRLGYVYLDLTALMEPTLQDWEEAGALPLPQTAENTVLAMSLRKDGLRLDFRSQFDTRSLSSVQHDWLSQPANPGRLVHVAPDSSLIYMSGQNLALALESFEGLGLSEFFHEVEYETGVDLEGDVLDEAVGEYAWVVTHDRSGLWGDEFTPLGLLVMMEMDNSRQVQESLQDAVHALTMVGGLHSYADMINGVPVSFLEDDYGEVTIGYGFMDDFLFFASSRETAELAIEGRESPLSSSPLFQAAMQGLPRNARGQGYIDVEGVVMTIYRAMDDFEKEEFNKEVRPYLESIRAVTVGTRPMNNKGVLEGTLFVYTD